MSTSAVVQAVQNDLLLDSAMKSGSHFEAEKKKKIENFNPAQHTAPKFDIFGNQKHVHKKPGEVNSNILKDDIKIPEWWGKPGQREEDKFSQAKLLEQRKQEQIPHPSYDLDGDGYVSGRDYFLAKRFDLDGDGRLNTGEKRVAIEALKNGYEKQFFWNVEQSGAQRPYRLLQKRGEFIDSDDFLPVTKTYPKHPIADHLPKLPTTQILKEARRAQLTEELKAKKVAWDKANPASVAQEFICSEYLIDQPKHTSINQIKEEAKVEARKKMGLETTELNPKFKIKQPGLEFHEKPAIESYQSLKEERKAKNLEELSKYGITEHMGEIGRLDYRENAYLRVGYKNEDRPTQKQIAESRKKEMVDYNMKTFGKLAIGVHGKELPKFAESATVQEWWKVKDGYQSEPANVSRKELLQSHKYWAKNDDMLLADTKHEGGPADPLKTEWHQKLFKGDIADKVQNLQLFDEEEIDPLEYDRQAPAAKWTSVQNAFNPKTKFYEIESRERESFKKSEAAPLYSSFSPDKIFKRPTDTRTNKKTGETRTMGGMIKTQITDGNNYMKTGVGITSHTLHSQGGKFSMARPRDTLITRVSNKKTLGPAEIDFRKTTYVGVRAGGFHIQ